MKDYAATERRHRMAEDAPNDDALAAEQAERWAGVIRIERGPAAYRVTFPKLTAAERGTPEAKAAWHEARRPMADVKAIMGRKFDGVQGAWIVPLDQRASIEALALDYAASIEELAIAAGYPAEAAARIAELERQLAEVEAAYAEALQHDCRATLAEVAA